MFILNLKWQKKNCSKNCIKSNPKDHPNKNNSDQSKMDLAFKINFKKLKTEKHFRLQKN